MLLLRSKQRFDEFAELDPATGRIVRRFTEVSKAPPRVSGHYADLSGHTVALFRRRDGNLNLILGENLIYQLGDDLRVRREENSGMCALVVRNKGGVVAGYLEYELPVIDPPLEDDYVSSFVEEKDFDFGLFVQNIANNHARQERIYRDAAVLEAA